MSASLYGKIYGENTYVDLHVPITCEKCGSTFQYMGTGEYKCNGCGFLAYDDYGKVRNYLETHGGATASVVEAATGVKKTAIRKMLEEERLGVKPFSRDELGRLI